MKYTIAIAALFALIASIIGTTTSMNMPIFAQENEAEIEADIEQENKCSKDTECENENEINNSLNILTQNAAQDEEPVIPTCETCFTDNLSEEALNLIEETFFEGPEPASLQEICDFIDENIEDPLFQQDFVNYLYVVLLNNNAATTEEIENVINCLEQVFGVDLPDPNID